MPTPACSVKSAHGRAFRPMLQAHHLRRVRSCTDSFASAMLQPAAGPTTRSRTTRRGMSVTPGTFRRLALRLPEATEAVHMGHPDFRVRNKIFASLGTPDREWATVKLTPEQQGVLIEAEPTMFKPAAGAWGRRGWTHVRIAATDADTLKSALDMAWRNTAPKSLVTRHSG